MNSNKKIVAIFFFCLAVAASWIIFLIIPMANKIYDYSERIIESKKEVVSFKNEIGMIEKIREEQVGLNQSLKIADSLFADFDAPVDLIRFWEKTAGECALEININPVLSGKSQYFNWKIMQLEISLIGSYPNILKFITKIESGPYLVQSQNLILGKFSESANLSAGLKVSVFAK
jgi:hypothetical protein